VTSNSDFKVTILLNVKRLENGTRQSYTYYDSPIVSRTMTWSIERRHFSGLEWPRVT